MKSRREFIQLSALGTVLGLTPSVLGAMPVENEKKAKSSGPMAISTWKHGLPANEAAWEILRKGGGHWMQLKRVFVYRKVIPMSCL
jgi:L-asparaginase/N4-(beta-N-acetylglucosaminyl)-L-asparaginase